MSETILHIYTKKKVDVHTNTELMLYIRKGSAILLPFYTYVLIMCSQKIVDV